MPLWPHCWGPALLSQVRRSCRSSKLTWISPSLPGSLWVLTLGGGMSWALVRRKEGSSSAVLWHSALFLNTSPLLPSACLLHAFCQTWSTWCSLGEQDCHTLLHSSLGCPKNVYMEMHLKALVVDFFHILLVRFRTLWLEEVMTKTVF